MTTKVDPTVEKKRYEIKCYKCGHLLRTYTVPYYYDDEMEQECYCYNCFSNSVQEAKAEERNLWLVVIQSALFYGTNLKTLRNHLKGMLQDFPSDKETPRYTKLLPIKRKRNAKQTK